MDFHRLEIFVEVVKKGTFSRAAETLFLTQPTVSSHMAKLEREVGSSLFERRGRKVVLTPAGEEFFPIARDIINMKARGLEKISRFNVESKGTIEIGASSTPGIYLLPGLLGEFKKENPGISFSINLTHSQKARELVASYQSDLGITGEGELGKDLDQFLLYRDKMVGIIPGGHPWQGKEIEIKDLLESHLIVPQPGSATRKIFSEGLVAMGFSLEKFKIYLQINSLEGIKNHVRQGLGVSVISSVALKNGDQLGEFFIKGLDLYRNFYVVYNPRRVFPGWVDKFFLFLKERSELT